MLFAYVCLLSEIVVAAILLLILSVALIVRGSEMHPWVVVAVVALIALCAGALRHYVRKLRQACSYAWTGPNGFTSSSQNPTIPNCTTAHAGSYSLTVTNASGYTGTASTSVVVNAAPTATASNTGP